MNDIQNNPSILSPDAAARQQGAAPPDSGGRYAAACEKPVRFLRLPEVMERIGLCRASIYLKMADGTFPKQISLGLRAVGWLEHEIEAWIATRIQLRGSQA